MEPNKRPVINIWLMVGSTISFVWAGIILFFSALFFYVGTKAIDACINKVLFGAQKKRRGVKKGA